jgi:nucleotide-binding universal stress UspA family protein
VVQFGTWFATKISTEITLLYVELEPSLAFKKETEIALQKLMEWNLDTPAVKILRMAMDRLEEVNLLKIVRGKPKIVHDLQQWGDSWELHLESFTGNAIRLKTRTGDIVEQILAENRDNHADLLIVGASQKRKLLPKIITFIDSSVLVIKNLIDHRYELMIATDGSEMAHKAEYVAIKTAQTYERKLTLMSVVNTDEERKVIETHFSRMSKIIEKRGIEYSLDIRSGNVVEQIVEAAGDKKIIFLGGTRKNVLLKYLFGSKSLKICREANAPIFIVKRPTEYR